jgi:hypothetical protein
MDAQLRVICQLALFRLNPLKLTAAMDRQAILARLVLHVILAAAKQGVIW